MTKPQQHDITITIDGQDYSGRYEIGELVKDVFPVTVWYRGKKAADTIPPGMYELTYIDFLTKQMLEGLVREGIGDA